MERLIHQILEVHNEFREPQIPFSCNTGFPLPFFGYTPRRIRRRLCQWLRKFSMPELGWIFLVRGSLFLRR